MRDNDRLPLNWPGGLQLIILVSIWIAVLVAGVAIKVIPILRRGRVVLLDRPAPCSMADAQKAQEQLIAAGIDAEIVESDDHGLNMWANVQVAGEVKPLERYCIQVPRKQASPAAR